MFEHLPKVSLESSFAFWDHDGVEINGNYGSYLSLLEERNPYLAADIQNCAQEVADLSGNEFGDATYIRVFDTVIGLMLGISALIDHDIAAKELESKLRV